MVRRHLRVSSIVNLLKRIKRLFTRVSNKTFLKNPAIEYERKICIFIKKASFLCYNQGADSSIHK